MKNPLDAGDRRMSRGSICAFVVTVLDGPTPRR